MHNWVIKLLFSVIAIKMGIMVIGRVELFLDGKHEGISRVPGKALFLDLGGSYKDV